MQNVINNFMYFLEPAGWNLVIISITDYQPIIEKRNPKATFIPIDKKILYLDEKFRYNLSIYAYNKILRNIQFWNQLPTEDVLIFQKDCIMYDMFEETFLKYDFAGANVYVPNKQSMFHGIMNGGFSLRKKSSMIKCLENVSIENINDYIKGIKQIISKYENAKNIRQKNEQKMQEYTEETINEDIYFTIACEIMQMKMPDFIHRQRLSIEFEEDLYTNIHPTIFPAVYHGWNKNYHSKEIANIFLLKSPYFSSKLCHVNNI